MSSNMFLRSLKQILRKSKPSSLSSTHSILSPPPPLFARHSPLPLDVYRGPLFFYSFPDNPTTVSPYWQQQQEHVSLPPTYENDVVSRHSASIVHFFQRTNEKLSGFERGGGNESVKRRENGMGEEDEEGHKKKKEKNGGLVESFVNWPNFISFSRMLSGPVLGWMILNDWYLPAFVGLAVSGATDWLDGYVARRMGIDSVVGSYLDPLADKVLVGCVAVAMVEKNLLHPGLVGLVVLRDVMLVGGAVYKRGSSLGWQWKSWYDFFNLDGARPEKVEPLFISKVNTVFQLILVAAALLQPDLGTLETETYITYLSWLVASTTLGSTAAYGVQYMRNKSLPLTRSH